MGGAWKMDKATISGKIWKWYKGWVGMLLAILGGVYIAYASIGDFTGWTFFTYLQNNQARLISIFFLVAYLLVWNWTIRNQLRDALDLQPNIVVDGFDVNEVETTDYSISPKSEQIKYKPIIADETVEVSTTTDSRTNVIERLAGNLGLGATIQPGKVFERYYINFRNEKIEGKGIKDADDVHARVEFYDKHTGIFEKSHEKPRWYGYPSNPKPIIKISTSLKTEGLYLVAREKGHKELYIFNDDSYSPTQDSMNPIKNELELNEVEYYIQVLLGFDGVFHPFWIHLNNSGNRPFFELISRPEGLMTMKIDPR